MSDTLTVAEAAKVAGVSVRTMRRWVTNGQVVTTGNGHRRRIVAASLSKETATSGQSTQIDRPLDGAVSATTVTETARSANSDKAAIEADRLAALVSELTVKLADQTALTVIWQERARVLGDQLALSAPVSPNPTVATVDAPVPFWRRLRTWLVVSLVVAVVGSASCQTPASVKHPGLCTSAHATMDFWANALAGRPLPRDEWAAIQSAIDVALKVC